MAALTIFIFSLLVSTTFATEDLEKAQVVEKKERPAFQALPPQLGATMKKFYFHTYYHGNFGEIGITDVLLWDDLNEEKLVARMKGATFQSDGTTYGWHLNCSIEFELPEFKGSTLKVMGQELHPTFRMFPIVGGTGVFKTLAHGVLYGRRLSSPDKWLWFELNIHGYYTPMYT